MHARQIRKGLDDWGFAGDLENMPTAESERAAGTPPPRVSARGRAPSG